MKQYVLLGGAVAACVGVGVVVVTKTSTPVAAEQLQAAPAVPATSLASKPLKVPQAAMMLTTGDTVILCSEVQNTDATALQGIVDHMAKNPNTTILATTKCSDAFAGKTIVAKCETKTKGFEFRDFCYEWSSLDSDKARISCLKDGGRWTSLEGTPEHTAYRRAVKRARATRRLDELQAEFE
ncbi:MAG: hypothetical protein RL385_146 [Pseudomonadota bacterium]|jgi:hypothetical protein